MNYGNLPSQASFAAVVRQSIGNPGPLVLDIEHLPLKGDPQTIQHNLQTLETLADWAHQAAPGKLIGYFGTNTLSKIDPDDLSYARELAHHVDAFFQPMYATGPDQANWEKHAAESAAEARSLDPAKPIYFYIWPQYVTGSKHQFEYISADYWHFQLATSQKYADGVVLWSPSRFSWDDSSGWWESTLQFVQSLPPAQK